MTTLNINGRNMSVEAANDTPLLWVIREQLQMTGTKFGCGAGLCGACTVHVNGEAVRSCQTSVSDAVGKKITTIEGLSRQGRSSAAEGLDCRAGSAMRLLPVRPDHAGSVAACEEFQPDQGRNGRAHGRQSLPLHDLFANPEGDHARSRRHAHRFQRRYRAEAHMNTHVKPTDSVSADLSRRSFLVGTPARRPRARLFRRTRLARRRSGARCARRASIPASGTRSGLTASSP